MKLVERIRYKLWLFFGGKRTEEGFKFLSESIIRNREMISKQRSEITSLKIRVWELEGHTLEETITEMGNGILDLSKSVEEIKLCNLWSELE